MRSVIAMFALFGAALAGCSDPRCDAAAVSLALEGASPGDTVEIGTCRVAGSFTVPPGVVLAGSGEGSIIVGAVSLQPGDRPTTLRALTVESGSGVAVRASGDGSVALIDVDVEMGTGIGVGVRDVDALEMTRVTVTGPIAPEAADALAPLAGTDVGSYGIVLLDAGSDSMPVVLTDVRAGEVGPWGAILVRSFAEWSRGGLENVVGTGLFVQGGRARLDGARLSTFLQGVQPVPAYGIAAIDGALVETREATLTDSEGVGLLHAGSRGTHTELAASGHRFGAVWVQDSDSFELLGASALTNNRLAGVVVARSSGVRIEGPSVTGVTAQVSIYGETAGVETADGIQIVEPSGAVTVRDVTLDGNERVGLLLDLGGSPIDRVTLASVTVAGTGDALGAIAQDDTGPVPSGTWDTGVTRAGATVANDPARATPLDVAGAIAGANVPPTSSLEP